MLRATGPAVRCRRAALRLALRHRNGEDRGRDSRGASLTSTTLGTADLDAIDIHSIEKYTTEGYPWAEWDLLRREAPCHWYERPGIAPFWAITRYDDVHRIGRDANRFINGGPRLRLASLEHDRKLWAAKAKRDDLYQWDP